jgi:NAD(P)-dependent dehydrogenase (short-subunit alcohol dehydrogenase family)
VAETDLEDFDAVMAVNVRGVAATIKHAARALRDGGAIVVVGSLNSWRGDPNITSYVASKHAVLGIVRSAALDLGRRGIRVNAVAPGPVATGALLARMERRHAGGGPTVEAALAQAATATALGRIATVEDVAEAVLFLARAGATTGHLLPIDGGMR